MNLAAGKPAAHQLSLPQKYLLQSRGIIAGVLQAWWCFCYNKKLWTKQLHPRNYPFCFSTAMMHSLWCARHTLIAKLQSTERDNKIMASFVCQMDKANLSQAYRRGELLFFTYFFSHSSWEQISYRSLFIYLWWPRRLHHKFVFCFEWKSLLQKCWSWVMQLSTGSLSLAR